MAQRHPPWHGRRAVTAALALLAFAGLPAVAQADTNTYTGPSGGEWGVGSSWSADHVPSADEDVITPQGKHVKFLQADVVANSLSTPAGTSPRLTVAVDRSLTLGDGLGDGVSTLRDMQFDGGWT